MTEPSLTDVRAAIDRIDDEIVGCLADRERLVRLAGRRKTDAVAVRAPDRVAAVLARVRGAAQRAGATPAVVERIYRGLIATFVDLELVASGHGAHPDIGPAGPDDAGEPLTLQRAAYATEAQLYGDPSLPALVQTFDALVAELADGPALVARSGSRIVGAVRGRVADDVLHVGRLTVAPDQQGRGIGTSLLAEIEAAAPAGVDRAALFTGHRSAANLRLYERLGYREERRETLTPAVTLVHLGKELVRSAEGRPVSRADS